MFLNVLDFLFIKLFIECCEYFYLYHWILCYYLFEFVVTFQLFNRYLGMVNKMRVVIWMKCINDYNDSGLLILFGLFVGFLAHKLREKLNFWN